MPKQKTIPELEAEIAAKERQLAQLQHKQQQLENRRSYYEERPQRHRAERKGIIYRTVPFSCNADQTKRRAVSCGICRLSFRRKAAQ